MDSYKKLMGNSMIFAIGNLGSKIITLVLVPFYTYYLTSSEFGTADLITTTASLLLPIVSANIFEAALRFALEKESNHEKVISNSIFVGFLGVLISLLLIPISQLFLQNSELSLFMGSILIAQLFRSIFSQYARGIGEIKVFAIDGIIMTFVTAVSNIWFLTVMNLGITGYLLSIVIANIGSILYLLLRLNILKSFDRKEIDLGYIKEMLVYAVPMIPNSIMWWLINASNRYFIFFFLGSSANGIFAVSTKIPGVLNILSTIFSQAWQLSAIEEYENENKSEFYKNVFNYYSALLFLITGAVMVMLKVVIRFLFADAYFASWEAVPFLLVGVVFSSLAAFLAANYLASKETKGVFKTSIYSGIISLILNVILIPTVGLLGAAVGNMISFIFMFVIRYYDTRKFVSFQINKINFGGNILFIGVLTAIMFINIEWQFELLVLFVIYLGQLILNRKLIILTLTGLIKLIKKEK